MRATRRLAQRQTIWISTTHTHPVRLAPSYRPHRHPQPVDLSANTDTPNLITLDTMNVDNGPLIIDPADITFESPAVSFASGGSGELFLGIHRVKGKVAVKQLRQSANDDDAIRVSYIPYQPAGRLTHISSALSPRGKYLAPARFRLSPTIPWYLLQERSHLLGLTFRGERIASRLPSAEPRCRQTPLGESTPYPDVGVPVTYIRVPAIADRIGYRLSPRLWDHSRRHQRGEHPNLQRA